MDNIEEAAAIAALVALAGLGARKPINRFLDEQIIGSETRRSLLPSLRRGGAAGRNIKNVGLREDLPNYSKVPATAASEQMALLSDLIKDFDPNPAIRQRRALGGRKVDKRRMWQGDWLTTNPLYGRSDAELDLLAARMGMPVDPRTKGLEGRAFMVDPSGSAEEVVPMEVIRNLIEPKKQATGGIFLRRTPRSGRLTAEERSPIPNSDRRFSWPEDVTYKDPEEEAKAALRMLAKTIRERRGTPIVTMRDGEEVFEDLTPGRQIFTADELGRETELSKELEDDLLETAKRNADYSIRLDAVRMQAELARKAGVKPTSKEARKLFRDKLQEELKFRDQELKGIVADGAERLSAALGISYDEAYRRSAKAFSRLSQKSNYTVNVQEFKDAVQNAIDDFEPESYFEDLGIDAEGNPIVGKVKKRKKQVSTAYDDLVDGNSPALSGRKTRDLFDGLMGKKEAIPLDTAQLVVLMGGDSSLASVVKSDPTLYDLTQQALNWALTEGQFGRMASALGIDTSNTFASQAAARWRRGV